MGEVSSWEEWVVKGQSMKPHIINVNDNVVLVWISWITLYFLRSIINKRKLCGTENFSFEANDWVHATLW